MVAAVPHRGLDGTGIWLDGSVGLGHAMRWTTPEAVLERQPLADETGALCLTFDGRVDNREELRRTLEGDGISLRTDTDAEIVLKAYERWGEECPSRILGDFAFAIWDGRASHLFCARDIRGWKPFYYYLDDRTFCWGSELPQLFACPDVPCEINEGVVADLLTGDVTEREETVYRGIRRLLPAHALVVRPGVFRTRQYWDVYPARRIRYRTDEEYGEHFLEVFTEAVRCRLRSYGRTGSLLSGGLDSSSIVAVAENLLRTGQAVSPGFETFSLVFPGRDCDESAYIRDLTDRWGSVSNLVGLDEMAAYDYAERARRYGDVLNYPNVDMLESIQALAQAKGFRVLLNGVGGDHWLTGPTSQSYEDLLRDRELGELRRQLRDDTAADGARAALARALGTGVAPLLSKAMRAGVHAVLPPTVRSALRRILRRETSAPPASAPEAGPPWLGQEFARRAGLLDRRARQARKRRFRNNGLHALDRRLFAAADMLNFQMAERSAAAFGLEYRYPFDDRRVIEFAFALPDRQRQRRDRTKVVLRSGMRGLLPESIWQRDTKASFSHVFVDVLSSHGGRRLFEELEIASLGWVDPASALVNYDRMVQQYTEHRFELRSNIWAAWMIWGVDQWYRSVYSVRARGDAFE
jgi:asparagine synthase (glutamine-hydrolysing)